MQSASVAIKQQEWHLVCTVAGRTRRARHAPSSILWPVERPHSHGTDTAPPHSGRPDPTTSVRWLLSSPLHVRPMAVRTRWVWHVSVRTMGVQAIVHSATGRTKRVQLATGRTRARVAHTACLDNHCADEVPFLPFCRGMC